MSPMTWNLFFSSLYPATASSLALMYSVHWPVISGYVVWQFSFSLLLRLMYSSTRLSHMRFCTPVAVVASSFGSSSLNMSRFSMVHRMSPPYGYSLSTYSAISLVTMLNRSDCFPSEQSYTKPLRLSYLPWNFCSGFGSRTAADLYRFPRYPTLSLFAGAVASVSLPAPLFHLGIFLRGGHLLG
jgi:hypothetical protein